MATGSKSPSQKAATLVLLILLLLATLHAPCHGSGSQRRNNGGGNPNQILKCNDMSSESQCSRNPKCRWCRSDALNDMCFSKLEALRLPPLVFSCKIDYARLSRNQ